MHDGDRAALPILLELDASKQRRRMGERNGFRQKTADLDFRIEARLHAAKEFDDVVCSYQYGGVGLLGVHGTDVLDRARCVRKLRSRRKFDTALVGFDHPRGA